jgi:hypothetical protein
VIAVNQGSVTLPQQKAGDGADQCQIDRYDTGIVEGTDPSCFLFCDLPVLVDVLDDVESQQKKVDLDSPLGDLMHDHDGKNDEQAYENES